MRYITGIYALNLSCSLDTSGDWHQSALDWDTIDWAESEGSFFGEYGIEVNYAVPLHFGKYYVANHIRALLDLLYAGKFALAQGMRKDYIGTDIYDSEIFRLVYSMNKLPQWIGIDKFMEQEYKMKWLLYKKEGIYNEWLGSCPWEGNIFFLR